MADGRSVRRDTERGNREVRITTGWPAARHETEGTRRLTAACFFFPRRCFARKFWGMAKPILGRGLNALLSGSGPAGQPAAAEAAASTETVQAVPVARVRSSPLQPRQDFSAESLRELADSIKEQGIVQPLIVRLKDDHFELIAGERRWRAAQMLGLADVPVIVRQADDRAVLELALIENLQRENLNPIEEAAGLRPVDRAIQLDPGGGRRQGRQEPRRRRQRPAPLEARPRIAGLRARRPPFRRPRQGHSRPAFRPKNNSSPRPAS